MRESRLEAAPTGNPWHRCIHQGAQCADTLATRPTQPVYLSMQERIACATGGTPCRGRGPILQVTHSIGANERTHNASVHPRHDPHNRCIERRRSAFQARFAAASRSYR